MKSLRGTERLLTIVFQINSNVSSYWVGKIYSGVKFQASTNKSSMSHPLRRKQCLQCIIRGEPRHVLANIGLVVEDDRRYVPLRSHYKPT